MSNNFDYREEGRKEGRKKEFVYPFFKSIYILNFNFVGFLATRNNHHELKMPSGQIDLICICNYSINVRICDLSKFPHSKEIQKKIQTIV